MVDPSSTPSPPSPSSPSSFSTADAPQSHSAPLPGSFPPPEPPSSPPPAPAGSSDSPRARRGAWRPLIGCGLIVFFVCLLVTGGHIYSPDEEILFRLTESIATHGSFAIQPLQGFATRAGRGGLQYPQYPPLQAILAIPLYGLARLTRPLVSDATIRQATWETVQYHDQSPDAYWNRFWVDVGFNPVVTALTAMLVWAMALRLAGGDRKAAWITALAYGLTTLALPHSRTFFTEPLAALWVVAALAALLVWADQRRLSASETGSGLPFQETGHLDPTDPSDPSDRSGNSDSSDPSDVSDVSGVSGASSGLAASGYRSIRWPLLAGLAAGAGIWTRVDFPLFLPGLSLGVVLLALPVGWHRKRPLSGTSLRGLSWRSLFAFAIPVAIALAGWFLFNRWRFGGIAATGYEDQPGGVKFATPFLVGLHGFLCSPGKGLFFFSPPLAVAVFGICRLWKLRPTWAIAWAATGGLFFLAMCKWQNWAGGWCWGPRHIFQIHALLILGLAPLLIPPRRTVVKIAVGVALVVGFGIQLFGSSQSFIDFYQEYFAFTAREQPNFYALYSPQENAAIQQAYTIFAKTGHGPVPVPAGYLPAPINDSIYVPQDTQWYAYPAMLGTGQYDFFWIHLLH